MTVFNEFSRYYDLLYRDKNYSAEADFVERMIRTGSPSAKRVLELGCGTGRHAELLVRRGFSLHGVDRSVGMIKEAETRKLLLPSNLSTALDFSAGDIRSVRLGMRFEVVISLFHVMSYQTTDGDLNDVFTTVLAHLVSGGIFIFDFWYGPSVLSEMPGIRVKRLDDSEIEITRIAEPVLHHDENCVTVNYDINVVNKMNGAFNRFTESHRMRYLFLPEINALFERYSMKSFFVCEWLSGKAPALDTWSVCVGAKHT